MADVIVIVADGIATKDGMILIMVDVIAFVAEPLGQLFYIILSSEMLNRTSSHIWGRWYLHLFLFRDGLVTLMYIASFIGLMRFWSTPHYTEIFQCSSMNYVRGTWSSSHSEQNKEGNQPDECRKALGKDWIPTEIYKEEGPATLRAFHDIITSTWEYEDMPQDLCDASIVPSTRTRAAKLTVPYITPVHCWEDYCPHPSEPTHSQFLWGKPTRNTVWILPA